MIQRYRITYYDTDTCEYLSEANNDDGNWCKSEDVAKLETENEKLKEMVLNEWCYHRGIHLNGLSVLAKQKTIEIFNKWLLKALEE